MVRAGGMLVVVAGPSAGRADVANAIAAAARASGRTASVARWLPRTPAATRRGILVSMVAAVWHLARYATAWHARWRWTARNSVAVVDGSFYDVLLHTDTFGYAKQLIGPGAALGRLVPRADVVVLVDDHATGRGRPMPRALDWEPWAWGELAPWMGRRVCVVPPQPSHADRITTLRRVYEHLGVDQDFVPPHVDAEDNTGAQYRHQGGAVRRLRRNRAYRGVRRLVPDNLREKVWTMVTRPPQAPEAAVLSDSMRSAVTNELRPDLERLRVHLGADFHCWGLLD